MEENKKNYRSPVIRDVSEKEERLIDTGMLHYESSVAGYNERYHRGETSHTIHVWWARRPHSAMRSLVFSSLCRDTSDHAIATMAQLAMNCDDLTVNKARKMLCSQYDSTPKLLDMFGGGGTIPFEAKRLGIDSYSIDSNQLSVFIQKCNMLYADNINLEFAQENIKSVGTEILTNLKTRTSWLYPLRKETNESVFGYVWTYRIICPHCGCRSILSKRPWLSKKKHRRIGFIQSWNTGNDMESLQIKDLSETEEPFIPHWTKYSGTFHCPKCNQLIEKINILKCEDVMTALIKSKSGTGKDFVKADQDIAIPPESEIKAAEDQLLNKMQMELPRSELPVWSGIVNPALYGVKTHADFLNKRQRLVLLYLIDELVTHYIDMARQDIHMAKFVIGALSSLIDQVVDWNCRLSMWIPQNEQVGRGFCGPGIAMLFDYAETDQVLKGPANLWDKLNRIIKGVRSFENSQGTITIKHAHAQDLPYPDHFFDAIVTDPPYYDNIYYSILADFFYAWKKPLLQKIEPELFSGNITDYNYELVASSRRVKENQSAHEEYCKQLNMAFSEAARVLKNNGIFSFIYSHSSVNGWEAIIRAYRQSDFFVSSVQPLSIERKGRPRAVLSQAVNTCVVIVARKSKEPKTPVSLENILDKTQEYIDNFGLLLIHASGWTGADAGLAVIACVVGLMSNASHITGAFSDIDVLIASADIIKKAFPEFNIKVRDSL